jgi:predicted transcriptional regulator
MQIIWDGKAETTEGDVQQQMKERFGKDYARTTVATFLKKLEDKGYLRKQRAGRRCFLYPRIPVRDYAREELQMLLELLYKGDQETFQKDVKAVLSKE